MQQKAYKGSVRQTLLVLPAFHFAELHESKCLSGLGLGEWGGMTELSCMHLRLLTITPQDSRKSEATSEWNN